MLFTSESRAFWSYSNRTRIDGFFWKNPPNWKKYMYHRGLSWNFQSTLGKGLNPGGKETKPVKQSFWRCASWRLHSSTESISCYEMEVWPEPSVLGTIVKGAGSRIGILADEVIYGLRCDTWRLHWSCDISKWRTSWFRKAWSSKLRIVEKDLA